MSGLRPVGRILAVLLAVALLPAVPAAAVEQARDFEYMAEAGPDAEGEPDNPNQQPSAEDGMGAAVPAAALGYSARQAIDGTALLALLESDPGGVITLTEDVMLDGGPDYLYLRKPVTVDAGPHTITVDMWLLLDGPITVTGSGTVIRVTGNGHLGAVSGVTFTADGDGSTALYLEEGGTYDNDAPVSARGSGATAINAEGDRVFVRATVTATGTGSVGIHTSGSAHLLLSFVQGDGEAVASDTGEITLEGGGARPMPAAAAAIPLHGDYEVWEEGWMTSLGRRPEILEVWEQGVVLRSQAEDGTLHSATYPVAWDESGVDYDTPGTYPLTGEIRLPFATELMTWNPLEFTVTVLGSDRPYITRATLSGEDLLLLHLLDEIPGSWWVRVWCSDDDGATWRDLDEEGLVTAMPNAILQIAGLPDEATYHFYLEVWGGPLQGISNTLVFYADPDDRQGGGEREGDTDGESAALPPVSEPPATELPATEPPAGEIGGGGSGGAGGTGGASAGRDGDTGPPATQERTEAEPAAEPGVADAADMEDTPQAPESAGEAVAVDAPVQAEPQERAIPAYPDGAAVWTADRLALLAADYPRQLTFHAGGLSADLPTAALLEALDGQDFAILLEQPAEDALRIRLYAAGEELEGLSGAPFRVTLSAPEAVSAIRCVGESGEQAEVERDGSKARVTLTRTGDYTLEPVDGEAADLRLAAEGPVQLAETEAAPSADAALPALWILLPAAVILAAAAGLLLMGKGRLGRG